MARKLLWVLSAAALLVARSGESSHGSGVPNDGGDADLPEPVERRLSEGRDLLVPRLVLPALAGPRPRPCLPAIGEELAFRGVIQADLSRLRGEREGWLLQGILFDIAHLFPLNFLTHAGFGLALGWVRLRTRSLYPGMLIHAAWNAWVTYDELFGAGLS